MLAVAGEGFWGRRGLAGPGLALARAAAARDLGVASGSPAGADAAELKSLRELQTVPASRD